MFVLVGLEQAQGGLLVHPLPGGSSRLSSLLRASGVVEIPAGHGGFAAGEEVEVNLLRRPSSFGGI